MTKEIADLENILNDLLPDGRLEGSPSKELLAASSEWSKAVWKYGAHLGPISISTQEANAAYCLSQNPVFICGVHRSGTTLVRDMLDGHPALTVLPSEGSYLTNLEFRMRNMAKIEHQDFIGKEWVRRLANPINQPPYWLLGRSSEDGSPYVLFARKFITWWKIIDEKYKGKNPFRPLMAIVLAYASVNGGILAKRWVDKTPTNERNLNKLWKEMPEAKIVHIIRNPAAIFLSRKRMEKNLNILTFLRDLRLSFQIAHKQSCLREKRYMLLHYEDVCANPEDAAKKIAAFLEIEYLPSMLCPTVAGRPSKANSSFNSKSNEGRILSENEHSHNDSLKSIEYELLVAYTGDLATKLGYPMKNLSVWRKRFLKLKVTSGFQCRYW